MAFGEVQTSLLAAANEMASVGGGGGGASKMAVRSGLSGGACLRVRRRPGLGLSPVTAAARGGGGREGYGTGCCGGAARSRPSARSSRAWSSAWGALRSRVTSSVVKRSVTERVRDGGGGGRAGQGSVLLNSIALAPLL